MLSEQTVVQLALRYLLSIYHSNKPSLTYPNSMVEAYTYNKANWVTSVTNTKGTEVLSSYAYTYSADGNQRIKTDYTGKFTLYTYDNAGRLINESDSDNLSIDYTYDRFSNRIGMVVGGGFQFILTNGVWGYGVTL